MTDYQLTEAQITLVVVLIEIAVVVAAERLCKMGNQIYLYPGKDKDANIRAVPLLGHSLIIGDYGSGKAGVASGLLDYLSKEYTSNDINIGMFTEEHVGNAMSVESISKRGLVQVAHVEGCVNLQPVYDYLQSLSNTYDGLTNIIFIYYVRGDNCYEECQELLQLATEKNSYIIWVDTPQYFVANEKLFHDVYVTRMSDEDSNRWLNCNAACKDITKDTIYHLDVISGNREKLWRNS